MEIKSLKWGSKTMHCSGEQMRREILRNTGAEILVGKSGQTGGAKVDKLEAQRNVLQLRPEMTCASWDSVQGLYTWCRSQWCVSCGGVQSIFSVLDASEVKLPALRAFVLPTDIHVSWGTWLYCYPLTYHPDIPLWPSNLTKKTFSLIQTL